MPPLPPIPREVGALFLLTVLLLTAGAVYIPVLDELVRVGHGVDTAAASRVMEVNILATLLLSLPFGFLSDWTGQRRLLIAGGLLLAGAIKMAIPFAPSYEALLGLRFLQGVGETAATVVLFARAFDLTTDRNRGAVMAIMTMAFPAAYIGAPLLVQALGRESIEPVFTWLGGALIAGGLASPLMLVAAAPVRLRSPSVLGGLREGAAALRRAPSLWLPYAFGFIDRFSFGAFAVLLAASLRDLHGVNDPPAVARISLVFWVLFVAGAVPAGLLASRRGVIPLMLVSSVLYGGAFFLLGSSSLGGFVVLMGVCGLTAALMYVASMTLLAREAPEGERGAVMGLYQVVVTVGMLLGMMTSGWLSTLQPGGYRMAYETSGLLEIGLAALAALVLSLPRAVAWRLRDVKGLSGRSAASR